MARIVIIFCFATSLVLQSVGQTRLRKLANNINHPAINVSIPFISLDGSTLIFISDYGEDNSLIMNYTTKKDAVNWKDPVAMPKNVNNRLTFLPGFAISEDGKTLLLTSQKGGGLGGYDIHFSQMQGTTWTEPNNPGKPINSNLHDGAPSLTADGATMYFMRCETMDRNKAGGCKIFVAKKNYTGRWEEPVELPAHINTGNSQVPRIMGDGQTLIFSSDKFPGNKGGMDLYETKLSGDSWSKPVALDFANTDRDDQYVCATSLGRYLMRDVPGQRKSEIVEMLFPDDLKPKGTMKIDGTVISAEGQTGSYITVFDQTNQRRVYNGQPNANGTFTIYLTEGSVYELSIEPAKDSYSYVSKVYDLSGDRFQLSDKIEASIGPIKAGDELGLSNLTFKPFSAEIDRQSGEELRRISRLIKGNPGRKFVVDVTLQGYLEDSVQSNQDLTEHIVDSAYVQVLKQVPDTLLAASLEVDSLDIDSLGLDTLKRDTMITVIVDSLVIKHTYHNDRTKRQADAIVAALVKEGVSRESISTTFAAKPELIADNRRTVVKVKVR